MLLCYIYGHHLRSWRGKINHTVSLSAKSSSSCGKQKWKQRIWVKYPKCFWVVMGAQRRKWPWSWWRSEIGEKGVPLWQIVSYKYLEYGSKLKYSYFSNAPFHRYFWCFCLFCYVFSKFPSIYLYFPEFQALLLFTKLFSKMLHVNNYTPCEAFQIHVSLQAFPTISNSHFCLLASSKFKANIS